MYRCIVNKCHRRRLIVAEPHWFEFPSDIFLLFFFEVGAGLLLNHAAEKVGGLGA